MSSEKELFIAVDAGMSKTLEGTIAANTTIMQVFNASGVLVKRYTYGKQDALNMAAPTIETFTGNAGNSGYIQFISPVKNGRYEENDTIRAEVKISTESEIKTVELYLNDTLFSSDSVAPYIWETDPTLMKLTLGSYTLKAIAYTVMGDQLSTSLNFSVQEPIVLPVVEFTSPRDGDVFTEGVNLKVTNLKAEHTSGISNVQLYLNNKLVRQENLAPFDWGLDGQNDTALQKMKPGKYVLKAIATSKSSIFNEASITITVEAKVSNNILNDFKVAIYPNPANDELNIEGMNNGTIHFWNLNGKLEMSLAFDTHALDISRLKRGVYIAEIQNANGVYNFRLNKN